jgi:3-deoxy-D-arabino-heptulosonate 7-phosphate (DAHP) synthase class II
MKQLIQHQVELQKKKKDILSEQEIEKKRLEEELAKVNKVKQELLKVAEPQSAESLDSSEQKTIADNLNLLNQQQIVIQQAIDKVKLAEVQGEKKGLENAEKLIKKQETQSLEQSEADIKNL